MKIAADHSNPSIYRSGTGLKTQTTLAIFSAFALTLITTLLILYRIITVTRQTNLPKRGQNTYKNIVDMIIQSSALYSAVLLVWAISWVITPTPTVKSDLQRQISFNYLTNFAEELSFLVAVRHSAQFGFLIWVLRWILGNSANSHGRANSSCVV